jgi:hypothetical protein
VRLLFEPVESEVERVGSISERPHICGSSQACCETLPRWSARSDSKFEFCGIVDALAWLKLLWAADYEYDKSSIQTATSEPM